MSTTRQTCLFLALALAACDGPSAPPDASIDPGRDAQVERDAGALAHDAARPTSDAGIPGEACPPLELEPGVSVDGFVSDVFTWRDARCLPRSAAMVRNDVRDPAGSYGGYLRRYTYEAGGVTRTCDGSSARHPGFGYTVNHYGDTASSSRQASGTWRTVFAGRHHAVHEYTVDQRIDGQTVRVTIQWSFATGRDHPLWAITYDLTGVPADAVRADTRSPYGDLQWDGGADADVSGVGWGDRHRFRSLGAPISLASGWDYTQPNTIPHVIEWATGPDAEMGLVQTQTWSQRDAGGYWFYGSWGRRDDDGPMPEDWNWTYQLNQYELPFPNGQRSKRMAWGSNYGAVGQRSYPAYGDDRMLSGWPYLSYAVFVVLGRHTDAPVQTAITALERTQGVSLEATVGRVATRGPAGIARTDEADYDPPGWDPTRAAWTLQADASRVSLRITAPSAIEHPLFVVRGWTRDEPSRVTLDGLELAPDRGFYASVDGERDELWLTLPRSISGTAALSIE